MLYRNIGTSGLNVSPLCYGTMLVGGVTDARMAGRILDSARKHGVNFIDTADSYMDGESERVIGKLIKVDRHEWVVATKVGATLGPGIHDGTLSRKWMPRAIEASLRRLGTDYVDIYYLHHNDPTTPLEETVAAIGDVVADGKALHWGFSNYRGWQIGELVRLADELGVPRPIVAQPYYNIMKRTPEVDYLPACGHYGIGVTPYSPVARGVFRQIPPGQGRAA